MYCLDKKLLKNKKKKMKNKIKNIFYKNEFNCCNDKYIIKK